MTQEEQLELAREWYEHTTTTKKEKVLLETLFPELKEYEDEKIRKELIERFKLELKGAEEQDASGCSRQKDIAMFKRGLAWLEKQGEQETTWNEEDEYKIGFLVDMLDGLDSKDFDSNYMKELSNWLKSIKPNHWKPSEEQMKALRWVSEYGNVSQKEILKALYNGLKKL